MSGTYRIRFAFCDVNHPTVEHYARWQALCSPGVEPYLIDIGDKKYHKTAGSAAQVEKMSSETEGGRTWNRLVELANENNRSGNLKKARYSVAKIVRDAYEVMNGTKVPNGANGPQEVVFEHVLDVVNGFFFRQDGRSWDSLFSNPSHADLRELWDGFSVTEKEVLPFTLPLYFRHLFLGGRSAAEIMEKIGWWLDKVERITKKRDAAQSKQYALLHRFSIGDKRGAVIVVGNAFEAEAASYQWIGSGKIAIGIIRNERGHVHIQSSFRHPGGQFDALAAALDQAEPGLWYYEPRYTIGTVSIPMMMNGSKQFKGVTPTNLSNEVIVDLVYRLVTFGGK
jgi:hypothetical protein